jgi:hypothetical protein
MCFSHSLLGVKVILVMCILFLHTDNSPAPSKFRLILASNRDEYYRRPAQQAHFWDEDHNVIGGTVQARQQNFSHHTVVHFPVNSFVVLKFVFSVTRINIKFAQEYLHPWFVHGSRLQTKEIVTHHGVFFFAHMYGTTKFKH